jgi:hypothetical protein
LAIIFSSLVSILSWLFYHDFQPCRHFL